MANFLKLFYLKTFTLDTKNVIRLRTVLNTAIFLSIFAVTASAITIFFEKKIDKIEDQVAFDQLMAQTNEVSLTMITYSIMTSQNVFESFKKNYLVNLIGLMSSMKKVFIEKIKYIMIRQLELRNHMQKELKLH